MSTTNLRIVDQRIRMAQQGRATVRGVVASEVVARRVTVSVAGGLLPAVVPVLPVALRVGDVVELERPRGLTGQLHVVRVLG